LDEKKYGLTIVGGCSRFTWVFLLIHKNESFRVFEVFCKRVQTKKDLCISSIRINHGTEFENGEFKIFYDINGLHHNFSLSRIPQ